MGIDLIILEHRKKTGLTQAELADKLSVTSKTISRWEKGLSTPDIYSLKKMSDILKIPMSTFYDEINKIDAKSPRINVQHINRYMSFTITSVCILLVSFLFLISALFSENPTSSFEAIIGTTALALIVLSISMFIISYISFYNNTKYNSMVNIYRKHLYIYLAIYLMFLLPYLGFIVFNA